MNNLNLIALLTIVVMTFSNTQDTSRQDRSKEQNLDSKSRVIPPARIMYCEPYPECSIWPQDTPDGK